MRLLNVRNLKGINAWSAAAALQGVIGDVPEGTVCPGHLRQLEDQFERLCIPPYLARNAAGRRSRHSNLPAPAELAVDLAGELQYLCGEFRGLCEANRTTAPRVWNVVLECRELALADACLRAAIDYVNGLSLGTEVELAEFYRALLAKVDQFCSVSSPGLVVSAARDRGITVFRLGPDNAFGLAPDEVLQLGEGIHQRRLHPWGTMTDRTGYLAGHLANDKAFVKALWAQYGIPVPEGITVADEAGALRAAATLGGPVVVKAVDADCGKGMTLRPATPEAVRAAFARARGASTSGKVIVERYLSGSWHRLLVVDQRLVAALRREPASVLGDGEQTIRELVAQANRDVRRGPDDRWPLRFLCLDETELENLTAAGLTPDSIPSAGTRIPLRVTAAASAGAESFDVTDRVHPETRALALDAVKLVGLDIAGLDLIAADISRPLREQQGGFLEINEQPATFVHAAPLCSPPRPVGEAIVELLHPGGGTGRVPLVVVIGQELADHAATALAETLASTGLVVGLSTPDETQLDDRKVTPPGPELPDRLEVLLRHPRTELVVISAPLQDVLHSGLGTDRCTVLVLAEGLETTSGDDAAHHERERLVRRLLAASSRCVINTSDSTWQPWIAIGSRELCLVGSHDGQSGIREHLMAGGVAALIEPAGIVIESGGRQPQIYPARDQTHAGHRPNGRLPDALATAAWVALTRSLGTAGSEVLTSPNSSGTMGCATQAGTVRHGTRDRAFPADHQKIPSRKSLAKSRK